jgi:Peptidase_C39 like family
VPSRRLTLRLAASVTAPLVGALVAGSLASTGAAGAPAPSPAVSPSAVSTAQHSPRSSGLRAGAARHVVYRQWASAGRLRHARHAGVVVSSDGLRIGHPVGSRRYRGTRYQLGRWTSPWVRPGFGLTEAVASWDAATPRGTWVGVQMRVRTPAGRRSSWDTLGNWASYDRGFRRRTLGSQPDDLTAVAVDTLRSRGRAKLTRWQLRITLFRRKGTSASPQVRGLGAMVSRLPAGNPRTTRTTMRSTRVLAVPRRSQMIHRGHYPQWGGGGEAWCSPTSTTMVLRFWDRGPRPRAYRWIPARHRNPDVDYGARSVYDYGFHGAGNWPFNTAYANRYGTDSFVTRLRSLREAERFVKAGIPLVASINFGPGELDGAPISSTDGHLVVIRGFTGSGRVIVNDPAARTDRGVRRVYRRGQFADAWVGGSGGLVYVIRPAGKRLPRRTAEANW